MYKKKPKLKLIKSGDVEGYTMTNIKATMSNELFKKFIVWMNGQTTTIYGDDEIVYSVDLARFIKGKAPLD